MELLTDIPIMVVMLAVMRLLEARGVLDRVVARLAPAGLTGLGVFAALQVNFVSFAAPIAILAMVMAMAQANVVVPMVSMGLAYLPTLGLSLAGGLLAAAVTYHVFGRHLGHAGGRRR